MVPTLQSVWQLRYGMYSRIRLVRIELQIQQRNKDKKLPKKISAAFLKKLYARCRKYDTIHLVMKTTLGRNDKCITWRAILEVTDV